MFRSWGFRVQGLGVKGLGLRVSGIGLRVCTPPRVGAPGAQERPFNTALMVLNSWVLEGSWGV